MRRRWRASSWSRRSSHICSTGTKRAYLPGRRIWQTLLTALYAFGGASALLAINTSAVGWFDAYPGWPAVKLLGRIDMICGGVASGLALWLSRRPLAGMLDRNQRRWLLGTCSLWVVSFVAGGLLPRELARAVEKLPPLLFIFVVTYYVERLTFFDVLIKKGAFTFASLFLLTLILPSWTSRVRVPSPAPSFQQLASQSLLSPALVSR